MVVDISFPFSYAVDGDIDIVNGVDFYEQHTLLLALSVQQDLRGTPTTANEITEAEGKLTAALSSSPLLSDVTASVVSTTGDSLTLRVEIAEAEPFDVVVPTDE